jgi:hypothetical protein
MIEDGQWIYKGIIVSLGYFRPAKFIVKETSRDGDFDDYISYIYWLTIL